MNIIPGQLIITKLLHHGANLYECDSGCAHRDGEPTRAAGVLTKGIQHRCLVLAVKQGIIYVLCSEGKSGWLYTHYISFIVPE